MSSRAFVGLHAIAVVRILPRDAVRELVQMRLANHDRAEHAKPCRDGGPFTRDAIASGVITRAAAGRVPGEVETVFERDWQAVERRLRLGAELARQRVGFAEHGVGIERKIHVVAGVAVRARERLLGRGARRDLPARECVAKSLHWTGCGGWHRLHSNCVYLCRLSVSPAFCVQKSEAGFKRGEAALEFPLLPGLFTGLQKGGAGGGRVFFARFFVRARGDSFRENIARIPEARARQEAVFEAGADHLLEVGVAECVGFDGADVFVRQVDARDAFIIRGEGDGNAKLAVNRKWMTHCR